MCLRLSGYVCVPLSAHFQHQYSYVYTLGQVPFSVCAGGAEHAKFFPIERWEMPSASLAPGRKALSLSGQDPGSGAACQPS